MQEPVCMVEIQMDYDSIKKDNKYDADRINEYIKYYYGDEDGIKLEERDNETFFAVCEDEHKFGVFWNLIFGLHRQEWFKKYALRFYFYDYDELSIYGDDYTPEDIFKELSEIGYCI